MKKQNGMTLIELMVSTVILAIIFTVGVPRLSSMLTTHSVQAIGPLFNKSIQLARSEAIQRGVIINVRPNSSGNNWSQGWYIEIAATNEVLRTFEALPGTPVFTSDTFTRTAPIVILPNGQAQTLGDFDMYYPGCVGNQKISFELLLSGILKKGVNACH